MTSPVYQRLKPLIVGYGVAEEDISLDAALIDDLNLDPIDLSDLFLDVEEEFDVELPDEDARELLTVRAMVEYIEDQL